jgi:hypothetical protein
VKNLYLPYLFCYDPIGADNNGNITGKLKFFRKNSIRRSKLPNPRGIPVERL